MNAVTNCIMLDMGKVLLEIDPRRFAEHMRGLTGMDEKELARIFLHNGLVPKYETGRLDDGEFHREVCAKCGIEIGREDFEKVWNSIFARQPILPDRLLSYLSTRAQLWIVSNTNRLHFDFISTRYSFLRHFRGYVLSHEVGFLKPDPRIFQHALKRAQAKPSETFFVDDQLANVEAARRLGMDAVQFVSAFRFEEELRRRGILPPSATAR